ncbi:MAG: SGNH/GDSL hydrolase family protein [Clostridiales bacterium]|jgi:lysophospholipase L1-like esterase|nr:SGNH/GDSL hydrolase family protein [Clostridiales bacterium]
MKSEFHREMIKRSLISSGNNYRMKKVIHKALHGESTTLVFLGASITMRDWQLEGRRFADTSFNEFKERFDSYGKAKYINAGMNGTSSMIGLIRLERDVLRYNPDIVFVEFSVNDTKDSIHREIYESMIVRLLESESKPAVVLLFMQSEAGYSCQGHMQVIGEHYQLPMISICNAIQPEIEAGRMKWSEYADDNIHPHAQGNDLITEFISYYFETVADESEDEESDIPEEPFYGTAYKNMKLMDSGNISLLSAGGFNETTTIKEFPNGWIRNVETGNIPFRFKLRFKDLFIIYKETRDPDEGSIILSVDGEHINTYSGHRTFGWNNPTARPVLLGGISKEHLVEIRMADGDEHKNFSILAFGYCE